MREEKKIETMSDHHDRSEFSRFFFPIFQQQQHIHIFTEMVATEEQLQRAKIPVAYRDYCSHLLIALNDCRLKEYWMPWKCEHERHSYEMCEYEEYVQVSVS